MPGYYPHQLPRAPELLVGQFLLTTRPELVPRGWQSITHSRWLLAWSAPLTTTPFRDRSGRVLGWLVGHAVHPELGWVAALAGIPLEPADQAGFDAVVNRLSGRFIAISLIQGTPSVFLDALGSMGAVFAPEEECAASTQSLIPVSARTAFDIDRILWTDIPYGDGMYPVGLTSRHGVDRLLPNHVLHTCGWTQVRCWPTGDMARDADPAEVAERMGRNMRRALNATARVMPLDFALTAGWDTRLILSCAGDVLDGATFFTADLDDLIGWRDVVVSRLIARRFGLRHRVVPKRRAGAADLLAWAIRTGGEVGEPRGWRGCRALAEQLPGSASITGTGGNQLNHGPKRRSWFARGSFSGGTPAAVPGPAPAGFPGACRAMAGRNPQHRSQPDFRSAVPRAARRLLGGIIEYGELGRTHARYCPIGTVETTRDLLRPPVESRGGHLFHRRVSELNWPELLEIPFNKDFRVSGPRGPLLCRSRILAEASGSIAPVGSEDPGEAGVAAESAGARKGGTRRCNEGRGGAKRDREWGLTRQSERRLDPSVEEQVCGRWQQGFRRSGPETYNWL